MKGDKELLSSYLRDHPETKFLEVMTVDVSGVLRGKRLVREEFEGLCSEGIKACRSAALLDFSGAPPTELKLGSEDGDPDCLAFGDLGSIVPVPWLKSPTAQLLMSLVENDGSACLLDPRNILRNVEEKFNKMGYKPVVATELEFYLIKEDDAKVVVPIKGSIPGTSREQQGIQFGALEDLWDLDEFLVSVYKACNEQQIPARAALSEFAPGQFEINLNHVSDPVLACDHAVLLKRLIKGVAREYGLTATFMSKPFAEEVGSGLHIHISLLNEEGENIFSCDSGDPPPATSKKLKYAIGGLQDTMAESMAIFAPNANSYRRFTPGSYAPVNTAWGHNHRTVSLRIPPSNNCNTRIEHRSAGADANPYLVMSAILAGIHHGIINELTPNKMIHSGEYYDPPIEKLPNTWDKAITSLESNSILKNYFPENYLDYFLTVKRSEYNRFQSEVSDRDYAWYLKLA